MSDLFDYMDWRGDILLEYRGLNKIDALIFTQLAYISFDNVIKSGESMTIKEAANCYFKDIEKNGDDTLLTQRSERVLAKAAETDRYKNLKFMYYLSMYDEASPLQFGAITIKLDDETAFVAFRGTDDTLVGWEEDFRLCYTMPVEAQLKAEDYLENVMKEFKGNFYVGGHSKGGNLAVYSSMMQDKSLIKRLIKIYNFDGPGFMKSVIEGPEYAQIRDITKSYMPQESIVGMILFHESEKYDVIQSTEKGLKQHVAISWKVKGVDFVKAEDFETVSIIFRKACHKWLNDIDRDEREQFINIVFQILKSGERTTVSDITTDFFKSMNTIIKSYNELDKTTKRMIKGTIKQMIKMSTESISENRNTDKKIAEKK